MSRTPQPVRGMQSLIGEPADRLHAVINAFKRVRDLFGFGRVEVPVLERTEVFARSLGESTDVVSKEMYTFIDKGQDSMTMRPEFTAGIARAYLSEGWQQYAPVKLATHGPAFRFERPQKGRFRQFHQVDVEVIGAAEPLADVEVISFAQHLLEELGISDRVELQLNTLGDTRTRDAWRGALVEHFRASVNDLSEQSRERLKTNPLRILDSKEHADWPIVDAAPVVDHFLTPEASDFFARVTAGLDAAGIVWTRNARLVRGLDYYRHTAFEFITTDLGAQGTVIGGGRYDGLIEAMGGPHTPAVGWAGGMERLAMLIDAPFPRSPEFAFIPMGQQAESLCLGLMAQFRRKGASCEMGYTGNLKKRLQKANANHASYAIIVGDDELANEEITIRSLKSGEQIKRKVADLELDPRVGLSYFAGSLLEGIDGYGAAA